MPRSSAKPTTVGVRARRCAIYTRKSSEEGLEQEFNSLDAQREACEAYARSQRHEGWTVLPTHYDDGGISGGTLERPSLQRLLTDIRAGKVDLVLVYKVDRLTRSLPDFAKIVEVFDAHGASFVSVTQHFNTATSMGRLTLNMLLSFAQFEREVAGERIRDKIAASKRKGTWMGGTIPLGYEVRDRKLVVNETEAERVRTIYRRYLALGSVRLLQQQLVADRVLSKTGVSMGRGALFHLLQNRTYRGEVEHKGNVYTGEHEAIVEPDLWDDVQRHLAAHRASRPHETGTRDPSLLAGLLFDAAGQPMTATHAVKGKRRYRYYISRPLVLGTRDASPNSLRVPGGEVEQLVQTEMQALLRDPAALLSMLREANALPRNAAAQQQVVTRASQLSDRWEKLPGHERRELLKALLHRVDVHRHQVGLHVNGQGLIQVLQMTSDASAHVSARDSASVTVIWRSADLRRAGKEVRLVIGSADPDHPDPALVRLMTKAFELRDKLLQAGTDSMTTIANHDSVSKSYLTRLVRLVWLAPDIVSSILEGRQPEGVTATRLVKDSRLPLEWDKQRALLGFS